MFIIFIELNIVVKYEKTQYLSIHIFYEVIILLVKLIEMVFLIVSIYWID